MEGGTEKAGGLDTVIVAAASPIQVVAVVIEPVVVESAAVAVATEAALRLQQTGGNI